MQRYNSKVSVKYSEENLVLREVSYWYLFNFNLIVTLFNKWILWCYLLNVWHCNVGKWVGGPRGKYSLSEI